MCDLWMDVDAALAEVPVNIMPLLDDTDFKSREVAIVYNQAGMDLVWNFVTTAGAFTQTAVTPTTAGVYDWAHQGDGMYSIEIPASGGASINNDTEGFGWFTGFCTGVLPWRGPVIGFRAAGLNDKLIESAYDTPRGLAGTALPNAAAEAAGGLITRGTGAGQVNQDANGRIDVNVHAAAGTAWGSGAITAGAIATDAIGSAEVSAAAVTKIQAGLATATALSDVETIAAAISAKTTNLPSDPADASVVAGLIAAVETKVDTVDTVVDAILVDTAEIGAAGAGLTALASAANLATVAGYLDTEIAAILADTNELQTDWANGGRLDLLIDAIKAKTDLVPAAPAAVGDIPTAAANAAALMDLANGIETSITPRQALRLILAASAGKLSGAATTTVTIRNVGDSKNRITATVDSDGNRSAVTTDAT
jgi:hypothetical protein